MCCRLPSGTVSGASEKVHFTVAPTVGGRAIARSCRALTSGCCTLSCTRFEPLDGFERRGPFMFICSLSHMALTAFS